MTRGQLPERPQQCEYRGHERVDAPLQATRRADTNQLPHEQPQIEAARVDQQSLPMFVCPRRCTRRMPPVS